MELATEKGKDQAWGFWVLGLAASVPYLIVLIFLMALEKKTQDTGMLRMSAQALFPHPDITQMSP